MSVLGKWTETFNGFEHVCSGLIWHSDEGEGHFYRAKENSLSRQTADEDNLNKPYSQRTHLSLQSGQELIEEGDGINLQNHEWPENNCLLSLPKQEVGHSELKPAGDKVRANRMMLLPTACLSCRSPLCRMLLILKIYMGLKSSCSDSCLKILWHTGKYKNDNFDSGGPWTTSSYRLTAL